METHGGWTDALRGTWSLRARCGKNCAGRYAGEGRSEGHGAVERTKPSRPMAVAHEGMVSRPDPTPSKPRGASRSMFPLAVRRGLAL